MENNKLKELAQEYFATYKTIDEQSLYTFLADNQWKIYCDYDRNTHKEKMIDELTEKEYDTNKIPDDLIDDMVERFEDFYYDDNYRWVDIMHDVIYDYEEDLEEYKLEEDNGEEI